MHPAAHTSRSARLLSNKGSDRDGDKITCEQL